MELCGQEDVEDSGMSAHTGQSASWRHGPAHGLKNYILVRL